MKVIYTIHSFYSDGTSKTVEAAPDRYGSFLLESLKDLFPSRHIRPGLVKYPRTEGELEREFTGDITIESIYHSL